MKSLLGYAAFGGALGLVDAKALKWSPDDNEKRWAPPQETLGFMAALGMNDIDGSPPPAPTSPPILDARRLQGRSTTDNTCGYINGIESNSMWCPTSQFCAYNSINSHIGCCDDSLSKVGCNVWTTCLASADKASYTTDNGLTLWCGFSDYPNCLTHIYEDPVATGYTLLGCGVAAGTDKIFVTAETSTTSAASSFSFTLTRNPTRTTSPTTSTPANGLGPNATNPPVPQSSSSSSTPIGPIVGGVVGGVAALALIAFGIFFLVRSNKKRKGNIAPPTAAAAVPPPTAPQGPPPPAMTQQGSYYDPSGAGFAHLDPRASIAKPPYGYEQNVSPPSSPPLPAHSPAPVYNAQNVTPSPPPGGYGAYSPQGQQQQQGFPQQQQGYSPQQQQAMYSQQQQGYPEQQQQGYSPQQQQPPYQAYQQQQSPPQFVAELPTQRGDGEVRELAG